MTRNERRPYVERWEGQLFLCIPYGNAEEIVAVPIDETEAAALRNELDREVKTHDPLPGVPNLFKRT